jgi:hypothetical protein
MKVKVIKSGDIYRVMAELPNGEQVKLTEATAGINEEKAKNDCIVYAHGAADGWNKAMQTLSMAHVFIEL